MTKLTEDSVTYYDILNVKSNASFLDIQKQFRKLVMEFHPDTGFKTLKTNYFFIF